MVAKTTNVYYNIIHIILLDYKITREQIPTIGIWDDHDYGINNGNQLFAHKETVKKLFLDFIDEPQNSERRTPGKGIYTTYSFGSGVKSSRMILLDSRYHKSNYMSESSEADILGEEQWKWLEEVLVNNDETFTFISSGTQILPFTRMLSEAWFYKSRERLFELISKTKKSGVILLSGDIHMAQILKTFCTLPGK